MDSSGHRRARSTATNKNSLYDSYIRAVRWASDRIVNAEHGGIVAFVTNGGYIDGKAADGLRLTLADEFHHIYIYNLRGNQRTAGEQSRKEGGKIFGSGSRATVAIMLLVRQPGPDPISGAVIRYRDIGDYLNREKKLAILDSALRSSNGIAPSIDAVGWVTIQPNEHGDWINQRSEIFGTFTPAHSDDEPSIFEMRTNGLKTNRDAWNYNTSRSKLEKNVSRMIDHYNTQVDAFTRNNPNLTGTAKAKADLAKKAVDRDPSTFSWDRSDFQRIAKGEHYEEADALYMTATYRPFHRRHVNAGRKLNNVVGQLPKVYPTADSENLALGVIEPGSPAPFTTFAVSRLPDGKVVGAGNAMQFFPRYIYEEPGPADEMSAADSLFDGVTEGDQDRHSEGRRLNVTDYALAEYQTVDPAIGKDDIFFYVYGILHSPDYRTTFAADLKRSLPHIPMVEDAVDFWSFSNAGRELAELHTEYETVEPWPGLHISYGVGFDPVLPDAFSLEKMRYRKAPHPDEPGRRKIDDKTTIIYNPQITISAIPEQAHNYKLGARSALDWVVESYQVKTHKQSGIVNDPNNWAIEHDNPTYILDLIGRVVTVSMRTLEVVGDLPALRL